MKHSRFNKKSPLQKKKEALKKLEKLIQSSKKSKGKIKQAQ